MGRARQWLGILLHCGKCNKEEKNDDSINLPREKKGKKSASFGNRVWNKSSNLNANNETEQSKHALTAAVASAAAGDAAVTAAVRIQSFFRGHLARKALRALRSLVQLQSLIRGYLARRITAAELQRAAAAVRPHSGGRRTSSFQKSFENGSSEKKSPFFFRRLPTSFDSSSSPLEHSPKIVEMDTFRPSMLYSPRIHHYSVRKCLCCSNSAHNSPRFLKPAYTSPATPTKLCPEEFRRLLSCPSYMASTQSFTAKTRPQSAPRQRGDTTTWKTSAPAVIEAVRSSCSRIPEGVRLRSAVMKMIVEREAGMLNW